MEFVVPDDKSPVLLSEAESARIIAAAEQALKIADDRNQLPPEMPLSRRPRSS
jgi:hypothetical protein